MSTRYVWDKTVATKKYKQTTTTQNNGTKSVTVGSSYQFDESTGIYSIVEGSTYTAADFDEFLGITEIKKYGNTSKYLIDATPNIDDNKIGHLMLSLKENSHYWLLSELSGVNVIAEPYASNGSKTTCNHHFFAETIGSGPHVEYLSSSTSNAYKTGVDETGEYYLVYLGSDSIDPKSVSFSGTEPDPDGNMSVVVRPATNTLGGNILYQYQYSIDNGASWSDAGEKTAATVKDIAVPLEAEQFVVRVQASDDIGFTSMTYVKTASIKVQTMRLWVGVENSARKGQKLWVGVDGAARPVTRAWVGDENGKARRWF